MGLGNLVKNVAGGAINRTMARLMGSGAQSDSRLVNAKAKWSGRDSKKDWRVRLQIPQGSELENYFFSSNPLLKPLLEDKGFFFPLTPSMIIQHSANYNALGQTHSNYPFQAYQNSQVDQMNIIGEFPVQNSEDAKYWVATIAFLRTITKMFFGKDKMFKGNPPPILHLSGYGDHMFDKVPVIVQSMNVELRGGIDYISTKQGPLDKTQEEKITEIRNRWSTINSPHFNGDWETALGLNTTKSDEAEPVTWAPTLSLVSCGVIPVYSREIVKHFSLKDFASGKLGKEQGIGFI